MKCLLVDDHALVRDALALLIALHHPDVDLRHAGRLQVACALLAAEPDVHDALGTCRAHEHPVARVAISTVRPLVRLAVPLLNEAPVIREIDLPPSSRRGCLARADPRSNRLDERILEAGVREVRGRGLLLAGLLDRDASPVVDECRARGLLVLTAGPDVLRLLPPLVVTEAEVDQALGVLHEVLA